MKTFRPIAAGLLASPLLAIPALLAMAGAGPSQDEPTADEPVRTRSALPSDADRIAALESQVMILTRALNDARTRIAHLEGSVPPNPIPHLKAIGSPSPDQGGPDPRLGALIRQLLQENVDAERAKSLTEEMIAWAEDDRDRRGDLIGFARRAVDADIGNEAAREAIQKMLKSLSNDGEGQQP
ncbi:hypothetical protein BH23PLA1_BH23PLA1_32440 [soil metagenome]